MNILIVHNINYGNIIRHLGDITSNVDHFISDPKDFDLVMFTGGEDVHPSLYGEKDIGYCYHNITRDKFEIEVFNTALRNNILMTGICRGIQFLNVMCGGKMMHDIENHAIRNEHTMKTLDGQIIYVNSYHHQMVIPPNDAVIFGWSAERRSHRYINGSGIVDYNGKEVEAVLFPGKKVFGVQYHPEMMEKGSEGRDYYVNMVETALHNWGNFVSAYSNNINTN